MSNLWKWIIGLIVLAILIWLCIRNHAPGIQANLQNETTSALTGQDYNGVSAVADGREITLTGTAPSLATKEEAARIARDVNGVRFVTNNLIVQSFISPYFTQAQHNDNTLTLTGHVPDESARASVLYDAENLFPAAKIVDQLQIGAGQPDGWRETLERGMQNLAQLDTGLTRMEDSSLLLRGEAADLATKSAVDAAVTAAMANNFTTTSDIIAPQPSPIVVTPPVVAPLPVVEAFDCQQAFNDALSSNTIMFATSSATIDSVSYALLDYLAAVAAKCPDASIEVDGHTDSVGDATKNQNLSEYRASSVVHYLISKGVEASRLTAVGYGETNPIADNATSDGRSINRRIELQVKE